MRRAVALVGVLARTSLSPARLAGLGALGAVGIVVGFLAGRGDPVSSASAATDLVVVYGLSVLAPVVTLVLASATFGDPVDDDTLVYLWLRPVPRWLLAGAGLAAAALVALPVVLISLVAATAVTGAGADHVGGAAAASTVAVLGYAGVFAPLGLIARRALAWGILYILIWEGFIARAGTASSRWSVQYYARSLFSDITGVSLRLADAATAWAIAVPVIVVGVGLAVATVRLRRMSVA